MFASMFKSFFKKSNKSTRSENKTDLKTVYDTRQNVQEMLTQLDEIKYNLDDCDKQVLSINDLAIEALSIVDTDSNKFSNDSDSIDNFDDTKSEVSSIGENKETPVDQSNTKIVNQINSLQCMFTWNLKPKNQKDIVSLIKSKYGDYNLDISSLEFTFERFVGNLIIIYEMFHKDEQEEAQLKLLEVGKWLEEIELNKENEFYLSYKNGIKHVLTSTFIHMLYATNLTEESKWLLSDIVKFANMDSKSRAAVHAIRAAVLIEYGGNAVYFKKACECAKKACDLDPATSYWFYLYSLSLTAQRHFLLTYKSCPKESEINAVQQAIMLSDGKNTLFNYHRMTLDRDTIIFKYHKSKKDKTFVDKNLKDNRIIVEMIKTIISMEPKDPLIVVKCAKTLMTLPAMVRDFKLGKQYLTKALEMAPNDITVLKAVSNAVEAYKGLSEKNKPTNTNETTQSSSRSNKKTLNLAGELGLVVAKHRRGEDPIPSLTCLFSKYNGHDKWKILSQICSYTVLFKNDLKYGVEQFMTLIEQRNIVNDQLITHHFSSFIDNSKKFNLAELVVNEIRLATNSSNTSPENILFYYKTLPMIVEKCKLEIKEVDKSMRFNIIGNSLSAKPCSKSMTENHQTKADSLDNKRNDRTDENMTQKIKNKNRKTKHLQDTGPKGFNKAKTNMTENFKNDNFKKNSSKNNQNKAHPINSKNQIDEMKMKMSKFMTTGSSEVTLSNTSSSFDLGNLRNLQSQADIENFTQRLYQNLMNNSLQQANLPNNTNQGLYRHLHQNNVNFGRSQNPTQNPPSLLDIRPNIGGLSSLQNGEPSRRYQYRKK